MENEVEENTDFLEENNRLQLLTCCSSDSDILLIPSALALALATIALASPVKQKCFFGK